VDDAGNPAQDREENVDQNVSMAPALQVNTQGREKDGKAGGRSMETLVRASEQRLKGEQRDNDDVQDFADVGTSGRHFV